MTYTQRLSRKLSLIFFGWLLSESKIFAKSDRTALKQVSAKLGSHLSLAKTSNFI